MSIHSDVKVWVLTPEQMAAYKTGMDLGPPHRIEKAKYMQISTFIPISSGEEHRERVRRGHKNRTRGRKAITEQQYKELRRNGLADHEIADKFGIKPRTLQAYKSVWRNRGRRNA